MGNASQFDHPDSSNRRVAEWQALNLRIRVKRTRSSEDTTSWENQNDLSGAAAVGSARTDSRHPEHGQPSAIRRQHYAPRSASG